jgi:excisionase family DNA binding protein
MILTIKGLSMDEILTVQEVAKYLKVSRSTVWRWCNQGRLLAFKAGHGWRVHRTAVERMMGYPLEQFEAEGDEAVQTYSGG